MIVDEQTYLRLGRYLSGECSREEARSIESWVRDNPDRESLLVEMRSLWETRGEAPPQWDADEGWQELEELLEQGRHSSESPATKRMATGLRSVSESGSMLTQADNVVDSEQWNETGSLQHKPASKHRTKPQISTHRPYGFRFWMVRVAAALLLVGFVTLLVRELTGPSIGPSESLAFREVITEPGQQVNLNLDDGTRVRLNAGSVLRIPDTFSEQVRMVHLSGEAYFEVAGDAHPFVVTTDRGHMIEVVGTEFNVKTYRDEPFRVVVSGGVVSVREVEPELSGNREAILQELGEDSEQGIRLERGQMMTGYNGSVQVHREVNLSRELAWLEQRLVFYDTPLRQVARELERWYRVEVVLSEPTHGDLRVTATFDNEPLNEVFRSLSLILNLDYDIEGRQVVFSHRRP